MTALQLRDVPEDVVQGKPARSRLEGAVDEALRDPDPSPASVGGGAVGDEEVEPVRVVDLHAERREDGAGLVEDPPGEGIVEEAEPGTHEGASLDRSEANQAGPLSFRWRPSQR